MELDWVNILLAAGAAVLTFLYQRRGVQPPSPLFPTPGPGPSPTPAPAPDGSSPSPANPDQPRSTPILDALHAILKRLAANQTINTLETNINASNGEKFKVHLTREQAPEPNN